ncbi:MAG: hypothetical protein OIF57_18450 [Marinobacterium sp.]|nr:hypothetical protein [Marinobacterium sp.]
MTPTQIGLIIIVGVVLLAAIAYIAQNIENARKERQLKLMELRFEIRHANHLLSSFPAQFMTTDIQQLLLRYLQAKWEKIIELEESEDHRQQLERLKERSKEAITPFLHPEGVLTAFDSAGNASQAQGILREFMKFLVESERKGDISKQLQLSFESRLKRAYQRTVCELEIFEGLAIEAMSGSTSALPKLRNCFYTLDNLNRDHSLDRQVYEVRTYVDQLIEQKKKEEEEREEERRKAAEEEDWFNKMQ